MTTQTNPGTPLPTSLFDVIAWVETKNNPHAMRFEPTVYTGFPSKRLSTAWARIRSVNNCSEGTADMIYSTSFGAVQVMGFNLYSGSYGGDIVSFCGDTIAQATVFEEFVSNNGILCTPDTLAAQPAVRSSFARKYNGDQTGAYAAQIVYALQHFGFKVTP